MNLDVRLGTLFNQKPDAPRLITGKILINHATARQDQWKLVVRCFLRRLKLDRMKLRFSVGMIETLFKQTRRARMIFRRARPEDAVLLLDLLPRDAVVISVTT